MFVGFFTQEVLEELAKFKIALRKYFESKDQSCVIFERNFKSQHLQLQVHWLVCHCHSSCIYHVISVQIVPVPKIPSDALRQAFIDHGRSMGVELETVPRETPVSEVNSLTLNPPPLGQCMYLLNMHLPTHTFNIHHLCPPSFHTHSWRTQVSRTS